jgi:YggT family protein
VTYYLVVAIRWLAGLVQLVILARALISWLHVDPYSPLVRILVRVTEPILRPFRRVLPMWQGVDLSPVAAMVAIQLLESILVG